MASIPGTAGADSVIDITASNDQLQGFQGGDTYVFRTGNGIDVVTDAGDVSATIIDRLHFIDRNPINFVFSRSGTDLVITSGADQVTVVGQFVTSSPVSRIEQVVDQNGLAYSLITGLTGTSGRDIVVGTNVGETLRGAEGDDIVYGNGGNDNVIGGNGNDVMYGGDGNDTVNGGAGNDRLTGGAGNDTLIGGIGSDTASYEDSVAGVVVSLAITSAQNTVGAGTDTLSEIENLTGGSANDTLTGNSEANVLSGLGGNDTLRGGGGNDTLIGGLGDDTLDGGAATDTASYADASGGVTVSLAVTAAQNTGSAGTDTLTAIENLTGSAHDDTLVGNAGANILSGGAGSDTLDGGAGNDTLNGGDGTDTASYSSAASAVTVSLAVGTSQATGGAGSDTLLSIESLIGSSFNDTLTGNSGNNRLDGAAGNDILIGGAGNNTLIGGSGIDTASYAAATTAITVSLANAAAQTTGGGGIDTLSEIENLTGGSGADHLTGNALENVLTGNAGADTLIGGAGNDTLDGGAGNDIYRYTSLALDGDVGAGQVDTVIANTGDSIDFTPEVEAQLRMGGISLATLGTNITLGSGFAVGTNIRFTSGQLQIDVNGDQSFSSAQDFAISLAGIGSVTYNATIDLFTLGAAISFNGTAGNDTIVGDANDNTLTGLGGNDTLIGGLGNDTLNGGAGTDTASYTDATAGVTVSLAITAAQNTGSTGSTGTDTLISIENLTGGGFNDTLTGNTGANVLVGGAGDDTLDGGAGNDTLNGGDGTDTASYANATSAVNVSLAVLTAQATGGAGSDTLLSIENLIGSAFNDTLTGNNGDNDINGGGGNDTLIGGAGTNILNGGTEINTASYAAATAGVTVSLAIAGAQVTGAGGTDTLISIDNLTGGSGADVLTGNSNNNVLLGNAGNDTLIGGAGNDTMDGGAGADVYRYLATVFGSDDLIAGQSDTITMGAGDSIDFAPGAEDQLFIGGQSLSALSGTTAVGASFDATTNIQFTGGHLQIDLNNNQQFDAGVDFDIALTGVTGLEYNAETDQFFSITAAPTRRIALTFDDGPDATYTAQILAVLGQFNVHATFFVVGENIESNEAQLLAAFNAGHLIENHTWDHSDLTTLTASQINNQLTMTSNAIEAVTGTRPTYFRPPYGAIDSEAHTVAQSLGLQTTLWTVDTVDWSEPGVNAIVQEALSQATDQGIILMHDGGGNRSQTVDALDDIIIGLRAQGYEFVTVDQLTTLPPWDLFN